MSATRTKLSATQAAVLRVLTEGGCIEDRYVLCLRAADKLPVSEPKITANTLMALNRRGFLVVRQEKRAIGSRLTNVWTITAAGRAALEEHDGHCA